MKPGEPINEKAIAQQLAISRTPVREALLRLADEGLVDIRSHSGTFVSPIRLDAVFEGQMVREALELAVVRRAVERYKGEYPARFEDLLARQQACVDWRDHRGFHILDEEFHRLIADCAGTPRVWTLITGAKLQLDRVRLLADAIPGHLNQLLNEHRAIIGALAGGDTEEVVAKLKIHLDSVFSTAKIVFAEHPEYFPEEKQASHQAELAGHIRASAQLTH